MNHPGKLLIEEIRSRDLTQKKFSLMLWKKVSELNELIKGKRNITIQWDILLSHILWTPEKFWIHKQIDYDYHMAKIEQENNKTIEQENNKTIEQENKKTIEISDSMEPLSNFSEISEENYDSSASSLPDLVSKEEQDTILKQRKNKENIFINF